MQIILLNGKSVENVNNHRISEADTVYAVNRKSEIECRLLAPIERKVDVWTVIPIPDFAEMYDEICEFLQREDDNRLILWSPALYKNSYLTDARPLPNPHKILFADNLIDKIFSFSNGSINSFSVLLAILAINRVNDIAVFGCDGLDAEGNNDIYFSQSKLSSAKRNRNRIYQDMLDFDQYIEPLLNFLGPFDSPIQNVNPDSHYKSLLKVEKAHRQLNDCTERFLPSTPGYTNSEIAHFVHCKHMIKQLEISEKHRKSLQLSRLSGFVKRLAKRDSD